MIRNNVAALMGQQRLKAKDLSQKSGIRPNTISNLWHEKAKEISFEVMDKLCEALECTPGQLFEYIKNEPLAPPELPPIVQELPSSPEASPSPPKRKRGRPRKNPEAEPKASKK